MKPLHKTLPTFLKLLPPNDISIDNFSPFSHGTVVQHSVPLGRVALRMSPQAQADGPGPEPAERVEGRRSAPPPGYYHRLVRDMDRARSLAIFRRFDDINLLQLLALQAEIVDLKGLYELCCEADRIENPLFQRSFIALRESQLSTPAVTNHTCDHCHNETKLNPLPASQGVSQYGITEILRKKIVEYSELEDGSARGNNN